MNKRRTLLLGLSLGTLSAAMPTLAQQQTKIWRVGVLAQRARSSQSETGQFEAFVMAMRELGYSEGKNLVIEWRYSEKNDERLLDMATQLIQLKVDVIVASGTVTTIAAKRMTDTIPIVMISVTDPVASGLVASLGRPGGNVTGLSMGAGGNWRSKMLELMMPVVPKLSRVALLMNRNNPGNTVGLKNFQDSAQKVGVTVVPIDATTPEELEKGFARMKLERVGAVIVALDSSKSKHLQKIAALATKYRLPSSSLSRDYTAAGLLMSYGHDFGEFYRLAATYVDKILKGAKPADLPVQQPTKFILVINGKTAKALGLTIPPELLLRADEVIE